MNLKKEMGTRKCGWPRVDRVGGKDETEKDIGWGGGGRIKGKRRKRGRENRLGFMPSIY